MISSYDKVPQFEDHFQSYWHLICIQSASLGLPVIFIGQQLAEVYGAGSAIISVIVGNLISWLIGFAIISMATPERNNAMENVTSYLGKLGGLIAALILILAFFSWYIIQLDGAITGIMALKGSKSVGMPFGVAMGLFIAVLSIGGIRLIKIL